MGQRVNLIISNSTNCPQLQYRNDKIFGFFQCGCSTGFDIIIGKDLGLSDRQPGHTLKINPWALRDDFLELDMDRRKQNQESTFKNL